jgi:hypothetical protein
MQTDQPDDMLPGVLYEGRPIYLSIPVRGVPSLHLCELWRNLEPMGMGV